METKNLVQIGIMFIFLICFLVQSVQAIPSCAFGGTVTINGNPVQGTEVNAYLNETVELVGTGTNTASGYGIAIENADEKYVIFKVSGTLADQDPQYCDGQGLFTSLNLTVTDLDNDGYGHEEDCNDSNPNINPGAEETCNGIDDDCDDVVDGMTRPCSESHLGACAAGTETCTAGIWGGCPSPVFEICGNLLDDDCDGMIDNGCGGGGGGGGGGPSCSINWSCTDWSECINGEQTRICTDTNNCGSNYNKPEETQSCEMAGEEITTICVGGLRVCVGDVLRECIENTWQDVEICQWGCEDGACRPEPEEVIEEEEGAPGGLVGMITGSPAAFWALAGAGRSAGQGERRQGHLGSNHRPGVRRGAWREVPYL